MTERRAGVVGARRAVVDAKINLIYGNRDRMQIFRRIRCASAHAFNLLRSFCAEPVR